MNDERQNTRKVPIDFPWRQIEDITNDFAPERKIGSGGYGVVYKGVHPNGQEVAVKKLHHMPGLDEDQFQNELRILTGICHPNIVQLIGKSYIERDRCVEHQGRLVFATMIDRAICLEFLPKGSLEKHLSDEQSGLRWHSRFKIIKGICIGLKYLHEEKIFHLDLKPSNILLDKDMVPKIADFGLSRLFSGTRQSHTTKNFLCTIGYAPPEFVDKGKITNKFDVFSLGVIIIKVLAGPDGYSKYSDMPDSQDFINLVQRNWRKMLLTAGRKDASYLDAYCNQVKTCTEIALKCVESNSHKRPSIEDIISMLNETEETIDKLYQQLFVVEPSHLCFPFEPDKLISCPVHLTNNADHAVAYRIQPPNTPDVFVGSLNGIVPARSTKTCVVTLQKQEKPPPNLDTIHIQSAIANLDLFGIDSMFSFSPCCALVFCCSFLLVLLDCTLCSLLFLQSLTLTNIKFTKHSCQVQLWHSNKVAVALPRPKVLVEENFLPPKKEPEVVALETELQRMSEENRHLTEALAAVASKYEALRSQYTEMVATIAGTNNNPSPTSEGGSVSPSRKHKSETSMDTALAPRYVEP